MPVAVFYISGHGYGHAVRMAEVIRQLLAVAEGWAVHACSRAPSTLFSAIPDAALCIRPVSLDAGIVEGGNALSIDVPATVARLEPFFRERPQLIDAEAAYVRGVKADILVADIPHLAGEIGARAGVPVLGISNFTWDFIYEPFLAEHAGGRAMLQAMKEDYDRMRAILRLPFHHRMRFACQVIDVGLVAAQSGRDAATVLRSLGIAAEDSRTRVFVAWRGPMPIAGLRVAAEASPDHLFLHQGDGGSLPENTRRVCFGPDLSVPDVVAASDVVVSKLGYGTVAACVACGADLLFPPRLGFREDIALRQAAGRYLRSSEMPAEDFASGRWRPHLEQLRNRPRPSAQVALDGADECARMIIATAT